MNRVSLPLGATIAVSAILAAACARAQGMPMIPAIPGPGPYIAPAIQEPLHGITVDGHAEDKLAPDVAYADFAVTNSAHKEIDVEHANAAIMQAVMDALEAGGVAAKDVHTNDYEIGPDYDDPDEPQRITGYTATNDITATIRDLAKVGLIIDAGVDAGAVSSGNVQFDLLTRDAAERRVLGEAVANALGKAQAAAAAADVSLGPLLNLTESGAAPTPPPMPIFAAAMRPNAPPPTPISPQLIDISDDVTATFAVGPGTSSKSDIPGRRLLPTF